MKRGAINNQLAVAGQPDENDLKALAAEGFTTIVNLRRPGEANQPLSPEDEGKAARAAGLAYHHIPVDSSDIKSEQVAAVRAALKQAKGPVFVHCQGGGRACSVSLLARAADTGQDKAALMAEAERTGFPITNPAVVSFVEKFLDSKG